LELIQIYAAFPTSADCVTYLERLRWDGTPRCPYCDSDRTSPMPKEHRHHCNRCGTTFSVTVRTVFHHTRLPLQKWFLAIWLTVNARRSLSARQISKRVRVNKNSAWYLSERLRTAMVDPGQRAMLERIAEEIR
jgi:transposase-like protein